MSMNAGGGRILLRPLEIGDVLDGTFQVYRRAFVPLITLMAVIVVPTSLLSLFSVLAMGVGRTSLFDRISTGASKAVVLAIVVLAVVASLANMVAAGAAVRV